MTDTTKYKGQLKKYLSLRGVEVREVDGAERMRCPDPGHVDNKPTAVVYDEAVYCPRCESTWDIFDTAGMLYGLNTFPDKLKEVQTTLGEFPDSGRPRKKAVNQTTEKPSKRKPKTKKTFAIPVPVEFDNRNKIFDADILLSRAKKNGWGNVITGGWAYRNEAGDVQLVDIRFEGGERDKNVMSFYYDGKAVRSKSYPIVLYNLDKIVDNPDTPILIHEGAKCAEAAETIPGFIHTAWNGGAKKCQFIDWTPLKDRDVFIWPDDDEPGIDAAFMIKEYLPQAKIIPPSVRARDIKEKGADIVEVLQVAPPEEIAKYILSCTGLEEFVPKGVESPVLPPDDSPESSHGVDSTPDGTDENYGDDLDTGFKMPFRILGTADDGKGYFLDRHNRLYATKLDSLNKGKLLMIAPVIFWRSNYSHEGKMSWDNASDEMIELCGAVDFDTDGIRGRGAWRDHDKICYNDGHIVTGPHNKKKLYLKKKQKDIGITSEPIEKNVLIKMQVAIESLSFQTAADSVRCMAWATIAPFGGALPWRPAFLLTGDSGSGKTTVANHIIRPLAVPEWLDGGETTVAGVRGSTKNDTEPVIFEEAESGSDKRGRNREELFSLMVSSTSDDAPDARKGTKDQGFTSYGMRKMFGFISISTEVTSAAALNRLVWINMESANDSADTWQAKESNLIEIMTPDNCKALRARTWKLLPDILKMVKPVARVIQAATKKDYRFAHAESILLSTYFVVWRNIKDPGASDIADFIDEFYDWQPPEEMRDETAEIIDRLLDESVQIHNSRGVYLPIRIILRAMSTGELETGRDTDLDGMKLLTKSELTNYKRTVHRYGISLVHGTSDIAIATNHHEVRKILGRGNGYQRQLWRHKDLVDKNRKVNIAGKTRTCVVLSKIID